MEYKVEGRYMKNFRLSGFKIRGTDGSVNKVSYDEFKELIKLGNIPGFSIEVDGDKEYIHSKEFNISKLPVVRESKQMKVVDRIERDNEIVGYVVQNSKGNNLRISNKKAWEMGRDGLLSNLEVGYIVKDGVKERKITIV